MHTASRTITIISIICFIVAYFTGGINQTYGQEKEDFVQAIFIYKFTQFFSWEKNHYIYRNDEITICTIGDSTIGTPLKEIAGKKEREKKEQYQILENIDLDMITRCNVLFVGDLTKLATQKGQNVEELLKIIFEFSEEHSILTVSALENFAQEGGMISFIKVRGRIKFNMNIGAIKRSDIKMETITLLELAEKVFR